MTLRASLPKSMVLLVVISPAITTKPVLHNVSQATRLYLSPLSAASSTASETASQTLSGWPSVTDSDVKRYEVIVGFLLTGFGPVSTGVNRRPHSKARGP